MSHNLLTIQNVSESVAARMVNALRVNELRDELRRRGKNTDGLKNVLVKRFIESCSSPQVEQQRLRPVVHVAKLSDLNIDTLALIMAYLPPNSFSRTSRVSKQMSAAASSPAAWQSIEASFTISRDQDECKWVFAFVRHLCNLGASLSCIGLPIGSDELRVLFALFEHCDMSRLKSLNLKIHKGAPLYRNAFPNRETLDLTEPQATYQLSAEAMQAHIAQLMHCSNDAALPTPSSIDSILSTRCSALHTLRLGAASLSTLEQMSNLPLLQELELVGLGHCLGIAVDRTREMDAVHDLIQRLPAIRTFTMVGGGMRRFRFSSPTLERIDLGNAGKGAWIWHLQCPRLRMILCVSTNYGNGLRPVSSDSGALCDHTVRAWRTNPQGPRHKDFQVGVDGCDWFSGDGFDHGEPRVDVPVGCMVRISDR
jgi:hypothetical protein